MTRTLVEEARLQAVAAAKRVHRALDLQQRAVNAGGQVDVFDAIAELDITLIFKPLKSALGLCLPQPLRGIMVMGPQRKYTVLIIEVGESTPLKLFVRGGADALVGGLVVIDPKQRHVHPIEDAALPFRVLAALAIPAAYAELLARLSDTSAATSFKRQSEARQPKLNKDPLPKNRQQGPGGRLRMKQRLRRIELLQGQEKRDAIHAAAMAALEWGEAHGDISAAAQLVNILTPATQRQLIEWFRLFSPAMFNLKPGGYIVSIRKNADGNRNTFQPVAAGAKPFFMLDMPAPMPNGRKP